MEKSTESRFKNESNVNLTDLMEAEQSNLSSSVTLTIRLIRSFQHKNWKPLVIHNCSLKLSWRDLKKSVIDEAINKSSLPLPFKRNLEYYDAFKVKYLRIAIPNCIQL